MEKPRPVDLLVGLLFPLLLIAVLLFVLAQRNLLGEILSSPEVFQKWVAAHRAAPLYFIAFQFLQVLIFIIPGEIPQIAGGYLFGAPLGLLYSLTGIIAGSLVNFMIGRVLGTRFVRLVLGHERFERFSRLFTSRRVLVIFFLLFLLPGFPKDALCYAAGLSEIALLPFFVITLFGRLPALLASVMAGSAVAGGKWALLVVIGVVVVLAAGFGFFYRRRLSSWIERTARRR